MLQYKTVILEKEGILYYLLKLDGLDPGFQTLYEKYRGMGLTYREFMPHVTLNKELYDLIRLEGLQPTEILFHPLVLSQGNSHLHQFETPSSNSYYIATTTNDTDTILISNT